MTCTCTGAAGPFLSAQIHPYGRLGSSDETGLRTVPSGSAVSTKNPCLVSEKNRTAASESLVPVTMEVESVHPCYIFMVWIFPY